MKNNYTYNCVDKSLLLPYFKQYYALMFFRFVPPKLTANFITLISSSMIFILIYTFYGVQKPQSSLVAVLIAFCLHGYIVGDHLDGMQAKETGTSSPLGEFLDHYFDVYNGAIIFFTCVVFFGEIPGAYFYPLIWMNFLAFGATMMEELESGELRFGSVGTLEGVIVLIFFFLSWTIPVIKEFWLSDLIPGFPKFWLIIILVGVGYVGTLIDIFWRMAYSPIQFNVFVFMSGLLTLLLYSSQSQFVTAWWLLTLYSGDYIARIMGSYLCGRKHEYPDMLGSLMIAVLGALFYGDYITNSQFTLLLYIIIAYLALIVIRSFWRVFSDLKMHWHWTNPEKQ